MKILGYDITIRKISRRKKGCQNTLARKIQRRQFYERNRILLENALNDSQGQFYGHYLTEVGSMVVYSARKELKYSKNTYSADIYIGLMHSFKKWRTTV